jgi:hypothetical protein
MLMTFVADSNEGSVIEDEVAVEKEVGVGYSEFGLRIRGPQMRSAWSHHCCEAQPRPLRLEDLPSCLRYYTRFKQYRDAVTRTIIIQLQSFRDFSFLDVCNSHATM